MTHDPCAEGRKYMQRTAELDYPHEPSADLLAHIASCPICRGALLTLRATAVADPGQLSTLSCADCAELLAAYVDLEEQAGPEVALRTYPETAWHIWICADCAEEYRLIRTLVAAQQSEILAPIPAGPAAPAPAARLIALIRLARSRLHELLSPPTMQLGMARGPASDLLVVQTLDTAEYMLTIAVQQHAGATAALVVSIDPPASGSVLIAIDSQQIRIPLSHGRATSAPIALTRLLADDAPDIVATVEIAS